MNAIEHFVNRIAAERLESCFNPYADICPVHDQPLAPNIRRDNLAKALFALSSKPRIDVWIGRDLGYKGGRRTGLALTDEFSLGAYANHLSLKSFKRSTIGAAVKERTATNVVQILEGVDTPIFTWNVFPFHPHNYSDPFSNRQHTVEEAKKGLTFLEEILGILNVNRIIAIGNDAAKWTSGVHCEHHHVRHPSYGGQTEFLRQMSDIYSIKKSGDAQLHLI
ncbi:uracil-DNA glycosylase [Brucella intermedia]|uniref:uracil-DNA glycosylase n=1 Tax=Brucella intermedia TaxID=94625 RepID=UPI0034CFD7A3